MVIAWEHFSGGGLLCSSIWFIYNLSALDEWFKLLAVCYYMCFCSLCFIPFVAGTQSGGTRGGNWISTMSTWRKISCDCSSFLIILPHLLSCDGLTLTCSFSRARACPVLLCTWIKDVFIPKLWLRAGRRYSWQLWWPQKGGHSHLNLKMFLQPIKTFPALLNFVLILLCSL